MLAILDTGKQNPGRAPRAAGLENLSGSRPVRVPVLDKDWLHNVVLQPPYACTHEFPREGGRLHRHAYTHENIFQNVIEGWRDGSVRYLLLLQRTGV